MKVLGVPRGVVVSASRQLAGAVAAIVLSTFVIFGALYLVPGDPITFLSGGRPLTEASRAAIRQYYHLDDPFFVRYLTWLGDTLHGDFGVSTITRAPVADLIGPRVGTSVLLLVMATVLMLVAGVGSGALAGVGSKRTDAMVTLVTSVMMAIPPFIAAALFIGVFAYLLGWFPVFGSGHGLPDQLYHLVLPAAALAISSTAYISRITRQAVRSELASEHVETAVLRGLKPGVVFRRHVMRNASLPIFTVLGLSVAGLIATLVVVETAFGLNGLGSLLVQSVLTKDFAVVQAVALILVIVFIVISLLVDLVSLAADPRLREKTR